MRKNEISQEAWYHFLRIMRNELDDVCSNVTNKIQFHKELMSNAKEFLDIKVSDKEVPEKWKVENVVIDLYRAHHPF